MVGRTVSAAPDEFRCAILGPDPVHFAPMPFEDILSLRFVNGYTLGKRYKEPRLDIRRAKYYWLVSGAQKWHQWMCLPVS